MLLERTLMLFACPNEMSNLGPDKFVLNGTKCRQARMKVARHGAAAECRVGKRDDLSPALSRTQIISFLLFLAISLAVCLWVAILRTRLSPRSTPKWRRLSRCRYM